MNTDELKEEIYVKEKQARDALNHLTAFVQANIDKAKDCDECFQYGLDIATLEQIIDRFYDSLLFVSQRREELIQCAKQIKQDSLERDHFLSLSSAVSMLAAVETIMRIDPCKNREFH